jgi:phosphoribosyl-AMP cyclohydrolase
MVTNSDIRLSTMFLWVMYYSNNKQREWEKGEQTNNVVHQFRAWQISKTYEMLICLRVRERICWLKTDGKFCEPRWTAAAELFFN